MKSIQCEKVPYPFTSHSYFFPVSGNGQIITTIGGNGVRQQ